MAGSADVPAVERGWSRKQDLLLKLYELLRELKKHSPVPMSIYVHSSCTSVNPVEDTGKQRVPVTVACTYSDIWDFFL